MPEACFATTSLLIMWKRSRPPDCAKGR
jgi:hypothetical protein